MKEFQIINDYRLGLRRGITEDENCFYIPVRVTGTGETIRFKPNSPGGEEGEPFKEERLKSQYFNKEVLSKCARLPILIDHPEDGMLGPDNLKNNAIIGQTVDSWIQGDEIWGLARIYDKSLIKKLNDKNFGSTSPGFTIFHGIIKEGKVIEGPSELNHLAFVFRGHWDQFEGSVGYDNSKIERIDDMVEEKKVIPLNDVEGSIAGVYRGDEDSKDESPDNFNDEIKVVDDEIKVVDDEIKVVDDEIKVVDDEIESLDLPTENAFSQEEVVDDEFNLSHHWQPSEVTDEEILGAAEDEEILVSEDEEEDDREREDALGMMRDACDSAHPSLDIKMPHIEKRETMRSVVGKFMSRNPQFVSNKYANMRIDSLNSELAAEVLKDTLANISQASDKLQTKKTRGFVPSKYGAVDVNF